MMHLQQPTVIHLPTITDGDETGCIVTVALSPPQRSSFDLSGWRNVHVASLFEAEHAVRMSADRVLPLRPVALVVRDVDATGLSTWLLTAYLTLQIHAHALHPIWIYCLSEAHVHQQIVDSTQNVNILAAKNGNVMHHMQTHAAPTASLSTSCYHAAHAYGALRATMPTTYSGATCQWNEDEVRIAIKIINGVQYTRSPEIHAKITALGGIMALRTALKQVEQRLSPEHQPIIDALLAGKRHKLIAYDMDRSREWVTRTVLSCIIPELTDVLNS